MKLRRDWQERHLHCKFGHVITFDLLVLPSSSPSAVGITLDTLAAANRLSGTPRAHLFSCRVLTLRGKTAELRHSFSVRGQPVSQARPARVVVLPGLGGVDEDQLRSLLARKDTSAAKDWLKRAAISGSTIAASCTGVFLLAAAGLLDGRQCTTSWWLTHTLAKWHPRAGVDRTRMVIEDQRMVTAGASMAHLDLMLRLIHRFGGVSLAERTASYLVVDERPSQAPYVVPTLSRASDPLAQAIEAHVSRHLHKPITSGSLAQALHLSTRTLSRRVRTVTGLSPMSYVRSLRVAKATHLLRTTKLPVSKIAERVGLADASVLYRVMKKHTGVAPGSIRRD